MEVEFADSALRRLEVDAHYDHGFDAAIVRAFRKRIQFIRAATDERTFYAMKSLHYEKLQGQRAHQRSMRLNDQWRLILTLRTDREGKTVVVLAIEDYH